MRAFRIFFIVILFLLLPQIPFAESSYVLPYPSSMPGSLSYKFHLVYENFSKYWYFGNFGQFKYNLKMADKYLVEAKTLFEYKQYLLGFKALQRSNLYFNQVYPHLIEAEKENKSIKNNLLLFKDASLKHMEVLNSFKLIVPKIFVWTPEKVPSSTLRLEELIDESIAIRKNDL